MAFVKLLKQNSVFHRKKTDYLHPMQTTFSTVRLHLDMVTTDDYAFVSALVNSCGWLEFIGDRNVHGKQDAIAYINKILDAPNIHYWVIRVKGSGTPVGIISFIKRDYLDYYDIGFALLSEYSGLGYAYEAAKEVLMFASNVAEHHPIVATTLINNNSSIKLLTKLGLHFDKEIIVENEILHLYSNG